MTTDNETELDRLFDAARRQAPPMPPGFLDRIADLGLAEQPRPAHAVAPRPAVRAGLWAGLRSALGLGGLAGLALAGLAGVWIGYVGAGSLTGADLGQVELLPSDGLDILADAELGGGNG